MEYYIEMKMNELQLYATTWMNLENVAVSLGGFETGEWTNMIRFPFLEDC